MRVHGEQPSFEGFGVVESVDDPLVGEGEMLVEMLEDIEGGHESAGEEVASHPIVIAVGVEGISEGFVSEDVDKEETIGSEPGSDPLEEQVIVAHMLEHLDREDAVEGAGGLEEIHVGGDHGEIGKTEGAGLKIDIGFLSMRVGEGGDPGGREAFREIEREGTPAASEIEDIHVVGDLSALEGEIEHGDLGGSEVAGFWGPEAGTVLEAGAEDLAIEVGGDFVVLLVGLGRGEGERCVFHGGEKSRLASEGFGEVVSGFLSEAFG